MKPKWTLASLLSLIVLLPRLSTVWAFHFDQLPGTITAFQPQTLRWIRDDPDSDTFIRFAFLDQGHLLAEFGTTTIPETQQEGQIPFTFTYSSIRVEGLAGGVFFTAQPTAILATIPATTTSGPSTTPPSTSSSSSSDTSPTLPSEASPYSPTSIHPVAVFGSSKSRNTQASIIGGTVGGGGALVILLVFFLWFRRSRNHQRARDLEQAMMPRPFSQPPAPIIDPYPMEKSPTSPSSTVKGQSPTTDWNTNITMTTGSENHQYTDSRYSPITWSGSGEGSSRRAGSSVADDGSSAYAALQAQMRTMVQRLERIEAAESDAPPDYVSSYSGRR